MLCGGSLALIETIQLPLNFDIFVKSGNLATYRPVEFWIFTYSRIGRLPLLLRLNWPFELLKKPICDEAPVPLRLH